MIPNYLQPVLRCHRDNYCEDQQTNWVDRGIRSLTARFSMKFSLKLAGVFIWIGYVLGVIKALFEDFRSFCAEKWFPL